MTRKAQIATAAAALALAATPTAFAGTGPQSDAHDRSATVRQGSITDAGDRDGMTASTGQTAGIRDSHDRSAGPASTAFWSATGRRSVDGMQPSGNVASYPEHLSELSPAEPTVVSSGGFDLGDATIGVFGGIGLSLLLGGGLILLVSHGRTRQRVAIR
jgi:hypothetical protein